MALGLFHSDGGGGVPLFLATLEKANLASDIICLALFEVRSYLLITIV